MNHPEAPLPAAAGAGENQPAALYRRIAELSEAVAARDTFLAVVAHELRNPMTPIVGQVELLLALVKSGRCSPEQTGLRLQRIQHSIDHYLKRATVLLDMSRLARGAFRLIPEQFDLTPLLQDVTAELASAARHSGVPVTVAADTLPVRLDRLATKQIVDNLVSNALRYGGRTPVEVIAAAYGNEVRIEVRDHGPGISANDRARVLECFERVIGRGERRNGFGIGLWLAAQFAAAMQGTIVIGDAPGGGAVVAVTLPRQLPSALKDTPP